ncbi:MAG: class I SAM-dependent methyltransferase [Acidobacteria bacterium]|nr:class I SAM-dependent methyltransferase [Acidobacteriota bacterium]
MRDQDLEYTYRLEEDFWWFRGMREIAWGWICDSRPRAILDAGCGSGFHLQWLGQRLRPVRVVGIDLAETALRFARARNVAAEVARASITDLPFANENFDLITCFDVICQIPLGMVPIALSEFHRVLGKGGLLFVRVPAAMWLWSSHDDELQTRTRFSLSLLVGLLSNAGFRIIRRSYANFFLFPIAAARRLLKRLGLFPGPDVRPLPARLAFLEPLFLRALSGEARLLRRGSIRFPFGLSVVALAEKV